ncbi:HAD family hydrolase [Stigmatella aurantiaca]|uniref:HAD-superfamily hydrolase, subfamily IA n=2 Tax=Stigmatella aurantiaca TaxID=41 RepID=E3FH83_STIAD|nr:HAD family hydrolase [Stigmatella aurantiaca]ADO75299.1 HAD-superfamily hydrolase, subfamily IA [Stigmatella aurantiaca DW4/3-1]
MLILFDCDGVLIDSEILAAGVNAELLTELGLRITREEVIARFTGLTHEQVLAKVEALLGRALPEDFDERSRVEIDRRLEAVKPIDGVQEMLDRLSAPRGVCSNSSTRRLKLSLTAAGLWERFYPHIFSAPEIGRSKPAPDVFLHAAKVLGAPPRETLVIEDSVHGVSGAVAAGMRVIGFTGGGHSWPGHAEALTEAGAVKVVNHLSDVVPAVEACQG